MNDVRKMFKTLVNGQSALKQELLTKIDKLDKKFTGRLDSLKSEMGKGFKKVNKRLDAIGKSVAYLEDDAPTREEHDNLEERVDTIERTLQI